MHHAPAISHRVFKEIKMQIVEIYCQVEKFNPRLNCTVPGAWIAVYANGIEVAICREYEASSSKEALSILNQQVAA